MATINKNLPAAGARVVSKSGMCGNVQVRGTVIAQVTDRWSTYAFVLMDDGSTRRCEGLAENSAIGWYLA